MSGWQWFSVQEGKTVDRSVGISGAMCEEDKVFTEVEGEEKLIDC